MSRRTGRNTPPPDPIEVLRASVRSLVVWTPKKADDERTQATAIGVPEARPVLKSEPHRSATIGTRKNDGSDSEHSSKVTHGQPKQHVGLANRQRKRRRDRSHLDRTHECVSRWTACRHGLQPMPA